MTVHSIFRAYLPFKRPYMHHRLHEVNGCIFLPNSTKFQRYEISKIFKEWYRYPLLSDRFNPILCQLLKRSVFKDDACMKRLF